MKQKRLGNFNGDIVHAKKTKEKATDESDITKGGNKKDGEEPNIDLFSLIPPEIFGSILRWIPSKVLLGCCTRVSMRFNRYISAESFWHEKISHELMDHLLFESFLKKYPETGFFELRQTLSCNLFSSGISVVSDEHKNFYPIVLMEIPNTLESVVSCLLLRHKVPLTKQPYCVFSFKCSQSFQFAYWYSVNFQALGCSPAVLDHFQPVISASGTSGTRRNYRSCLPQAAALLDGEGNILDSFYNYDFDSMKTTLFNRLTVTAQYLIVYCRHNPVIHFSLSR